jgi:glycosyltransferase involved in cell wall biosynthesis
MKILHITPHLGGGVGKAHSSLVEADAPFIKRHYVLLEEPRDRRYADSMKRSGATLTIAPDFRTIAALAAAADIVQVEWWNHPRIYHCLCETVWPAMRSVFWCHISGLSAPFIPTGLLTVADRFLFTSACSLAAPNISGLSPQASETLGVINSGFGISARRKYSTENRRPGSVSYLGTVDFSKMSRELFDVIDEAGDDADPVSVWGDVDPSGEVMHAVGRMTHPGRVRFMGHTDDPAAVFAETQIFLYLLQRDHFGTAENALVEAMSCGCAPLVFANPAEAAIVKNGETGFVVDDARAAARRLQWMLRNPVETRRMGRNAAEDIAATRMPVYSAAAFARVYGALLAGSKRPHDFGDILGRTAAEWFLGTQSRDGTLAQMAQLMSSGRAAKGSIDHFFACYPQDESLLRLLPPDKVAASR